MANINKDYDLKKIRKKIGEFLDSTLDNEVHAAIPVNISTIFLIKHCPEGVQEKEWIAGCYHILHIIKQMQHDKIFNHMTSGGYVSLYSGLLSKVCGSGYKRIFINNLIDLKVIKCNGNWSSKKGVSLGYRISKRLDSGRLKLRTLPESKIKRAIIRHRFEMVEEQKKRLHSIAHLARWSIDPRLKINEMEALEYLDHYQKRMIREVCKRSSNKTFVKEAESFVENRYEKGKYQIQDFNHKHRLNVDDSGGRLYTKLTSLMSPLRNFVSFDGQALVSFDIKNSQPLHFLLLMNHEFWKKGRPGFTLERLNQDLFNFLYKDERFPPTKEEEGREEERRRTIHYVIQKAQKPYPDCISLF